MNETPAKLIVVTGMSGAGKSLALNILEDLGFETVDNLPVSLLEASVRGSAPGRALAIGVDVRTREFDASTLVERLNALTGADNTSQTLLYFDCEDETLRRRYKETRRPHPLATDGSVTDAIDLERRLLKPLKDTATSVIDTTETSQADLKRIIEGLVGTAPGQGMHIHLVSFAYRNGLPRDADLVFDVRFLRNPHYQAELKPLTGTDVAVQNYVKTDPGYDAFMDHLHALIEPLLPRYRDEGKSYLTIAIGCTGGRHRSVAVVEALAHWLNGKGFAFDFRHRDLNLRPVGDSPAP